MELRDMVRKTAVSPDQESMGTSFVYHQEDIGPCVGFVWPLICKSLALIEMPTHGADKLSPVLPAPNITCPPGCGAFQLL